VTPTCGCPRPALARAGRGRRAHPRADLLTIAAEARRPGLSGRIAVQGVIAHVLSLALDPAAINSPDRPRRAVAFGPFILFRRSRVRKAIGGHASVRAEVVEDFESSPERFTAAGFRLRVVAAPASLAEDVRLVAAIVRGWSKTSTWPCWVEPGPPHSQSAAWCSSTTDPGCF